jgi:hypothetical protein
MINFLTKKRPGSSHFAQIFYEEHKPLQEILIYIINLRSKQPYTVKMLTIFPAEVGKISTFLQ